MSSRAGMVPHKHRETGAMVWFPEGTTEEQADAVWEALRPQFRKGFEAVIDQQTLDMMAPESNFIAGIGRGMMDVFQGAKHLGLQAFGGSGAADAYQADVQEEMNLFDRHAGGSTQIGRVVGQALPTAAIPGGVSGTMAMRAATGALAGAASGGVLMPEAGQDRILNTALGALGGGVAAPVLGVAGKGINMLRGRGLDDAAQAVYETGLREGVTTPYTALSGGRGQANAFASGLNKVFGGKAEQILEEAGAATERLVSKYGRVGQIAKTVGERMQETTRGRLRTWKRVYDEIKTTVVGEVADKGYVPLVRTNRAAQEFLDEFDNLPKTHQFMYEGMLPYMRQFADETPVTFLEFDDALSNLSSVVHGTYGGSEAVSQKGIQKLMPVLQAAQEEFEEFIEHAGSKSAKALWREAKDIWRDRVVPFKKGEGPSWLIALHDSDEPSTWLVKHLRGGTKGPERAQALWSKLTTDGQDAARLGVIEDAYEEAVDASGVFNPGRFAATMKKYEASLPVFFQGQAGVELDGFVKLMRASESAYRLSGMRGTGHDLLSVGGAFASTLGIPGVTLYAWSQAGPGAALVTGGVGAGAFLLNTMMSTSRGARLLASAAQADMGSKAMNHVMRQADRLIQRTAAQEMGRKGNNLLEGPR